MLNFGLGLAYLMKKGIGQLFILDVFLWTDFEKCTINDDIKKQLTIQN